MFGDKITPNAHALARRFPLLDHVYANSEASIDGHFWTAAAAVSDYAKRGAVVHTRYDFLSFIRTLEIVLGMRSLNLFDALAVPMYDAFGSHAGNAKAYDAITPDVNLTERNTASSANSGFSARLPLAYTDRTPQRYLDRILWQYVHGKSSEPPPPGPNASGLDESAWKRKGGATPGGR